MSQAKKTNVQLSTCSLVLLLMLKSTQVLAERKAFKLIQLIHELITPFYSNIRPQKKE